MLWVGLSLYPGIASRTLPALVNAVLRLYTPQLSDMLGVPGPKRFVSFKGTTACRLIESRREGGSYSIAKLSPHERAAWLLTDTVAAWLTAIAAQIGGVPRGRSRSTKGKRA